MQIRRLASLVAVVLAAGAVAAPIAVAARSAQPQRYIQLFIQGPPAPSDSDAFINYDGTERNYDRGDRDWPIGLIFYSNATIEKVKNAYEDEGYDGEGSFMYEGWKARNGGYRRFDSDKGKKNDCNAAGRNEHFRIYGNHHNDSGRFFSRDYGYFVVASAHYDHGDGCSGRRYFGFSENVEGILVNVARDRLGWSVRHDFLPTKNHEEPRWEGDHYWKNDGRASILLVP